MLNFFARCRAMVSQHGRDRVSYSTLFDIGTCRGAATFARATAIGDDRHRDRWDSSTGASVELPITRASDRSFVVAADSARRRAGRLCGARRSLCRRWTRLCDTGSTKRCAAFRARIGGGCCHRIRGIRGIRGILGIRSIRSIRSASARAAHLAGIGPVRENVPA